MSTFLEQFDDLFIVNIPAREEAGEDSMFGAVTGSRAAAGAFDGCGGMGARKYPMFRQHTGAYMASRCISGAVRDWFFDQAGKDLGGEKEIKEGIRAYVDRAYGVCASYAESGQASRLKGSMIRPFPSTFAMAILEEGHKGSFRVHVLWAGDSRVYLLNGQGLAQLSVDDTRSTDALWALRNDPPMTNVFSSDGRYSLHYTSLEIPLPFAVFAASDGCFAYLPTPMDFENLLLKAMMEEERPVLFEKRLREDFGRIRQDDTTFAWMSAGFGSYPAMQSRLKERYEILLKNWIRPLEEGGDQAADALWQTYRTSYERYFPHQ